MEVERLFNDLESNNPQLCETTKRKLAELFHQTKEQWLVQGMMEYYVKTGSLRIIEVLVKVQSPHDNYIFEKISEWLKGQHRLPALTLFGFIVRKHPTWLVKVARHRLIKDILKLLQTEKEIVSLMTALLCIITLLPIIPSLVPGFLPDLFDVFGHLASWNCENPNRLTDGQLIHLQVGLQMLFHRLYGMYPCHFLAYLRDYISRGKGAIFHHTIKPLLETVRMHPMLITSTKDTESSVTRWKEMEPHDVVVECAKLSLATFQQDQSTDCFSNVTCPPLDTPSIGQFKSLRNTPLQPITNSGTGVASPFQSLMDRDFHKLESLWSPHTEILATPPPTGTVPHTPTPIYNVPMLNNSTVPNSVIGISGSSPPEAAVEATPETTPMKDLPLKRTNSNSHAVRALLNSSQPSSPMRKEQSPFNFPEPAPMFFEQTVTTTVTTTSQQRIMQMVNDRTQSQMHLSSRSGFTTLSPLNIPDKRAGNIHALDSPCPVDSTQEDQEVHELTSQQIQRNSRVLQDISNECDDCDETERSQCSAGGLHVPTNRSIRILANGIKRNRMASYCHNDTSSYLSYGTSPADVNSFLLTKTKVRRTQSWPAIDRRHSMDEYNTDTPVGSKQLEVLQSNGVDSSSQSGDDAISAATHFKNVQQKKDRKSTRGSLLQKCDPRPTSRITFGTQTVESWQPVYEYNLYELFAKDSKMRRSFESTIKPPQEILNQYIDSTIKMKQSTDKLREQFQLLHLQLQYERYRREIHAERNRRLMGRSRDKRILEMENERLRHQLQRFQLENRSLIEQMQTSSKLSMDRESKLQDELNSWKTKYINESEENGKLRETNANLQRRLNEEIKNRKEVNYEIEALRGEIFDMRNDLQHAQFQAELGLQYKQELAKLEAEFMVMGEVQIKCRDRFAEIENLRARDEEMQHLQDSYSSEVKDLRLALEDKTSQLDIAKHRLNELQTQFANKEISFTDQKRLLKSVKDEYEEKFKAVNKKYEVQKAIIRQMEQKLVDFYKNPSTSLAVLSPESDKTDMACSIDRSSPLSTSLGSSDGLSASLRSDTKLRNLQALVVQSNTASGGHNIILGTNSTSSCSDQPLTPSALHSPVHSMDQASRFAFYQAPNPKSNTPSSPPPMSSVSSPSASRNTGRTIPATRTGIVNSLDIPVPGSNQQHHNLTHTTNSGQTHYPAHTHPR